MKTHDLIQNLSKELEPSRPSDSAITFLGKWFLASLLLVGLWLLILPQRPDWLMRIKSADFLIECALWFLLAATSALIVHASRTPSLSTKIQSRIGIGLGLGFLLFLIIQSFGLNWHEELHREMSFYQGRCGPLIIVFSVLLSTVFVWWARKGAPTNLNTTGAWLAFSTATLSSLAMQVICLHDQASHEIIWHVIPVGLMTFIGFKTGSRWLRW